MPILENNILNSNEDQIPPEVSISGLIFDSYKTTDNISFQINTISQNQIKKIDVFINNTFLKSIKNEPFNVSFIPKETPGILETNTITVKAYDVSGLKGEVSEVITIK